MDEMDRALLIIDILDRLIPRPLQRSALTSVAVGSAA
jgi:hypothetical protein